MYYITVTKLQWYIYALKSAILKYSNQILLLRAKFRQDVSEPNSNDAETLQFQPLFRLARKTRSSKQNTLSDLKYTKE